MLFILIILLVFVLTLQDNIDIGSFSEYTGELDNETSNTPSGLDEDNNNVEDYVDFLYLYFIYHAIIIAVQVIFSIMYYSA